MTARDRLMGPVLLAAAAAATCAASMVAVYEVGPLYPLGAFAVGGAAVLAFRMPEVTLCAAICAAPLESVSISLLTPSEALLLLTAAAFTARTLVVEGRFPFRATPAGVLFGLFLVATVPAALLGIDLAAGAKVLLMTLVLFIVFNLVTVKGSQRLVMMLLGSLAIGGVLVSLVAIFAPGDATAFIGLQEIRREAGPFAHSNTLATFIAMAIPGTIVMALIGPRWLRVPSVIALAVTTYALTLTLSRGGIIAAFAALLVMLAWAPVRKILLILLIGVIIIGVTGASTLGNSSYVDTLGERLSSVESASAGNDPRVAIWEGALAMIGDHPLVGLGPGAFPKAAPEYGLLYPLGSDLLLAPPHAHNLTLNVAAERGLPAMLAFLAFLIAVGSRCLTAIRHAAGATHALAVATAAALAAFVAQGMVDYTFSTNTVAAAVMCLAGSAVVLAGLSDPGAAARAE